MVDINDILADMAEDGSAAKQDSDMSEYEKLLADRRKSGYRPTAEEESETQYLKALEEGGKDVVRQTTTGALLPSEIAGQAKLENLPAEEEVTMDRGFHTMSPTEIQGFGRAMEEAYNIKGAPLTMEEQSKVRMAYRQGKTEDYLEWSRGVRDTVNKKFAADPNYVSGGWTEDFLRMGPQVLIQVAAAAATGGVASGPLMFAQITGAEYENLAAQGVPHEDAASYAMLSALYQAPLEAIGVGKFTKAFKTRTVIQQKIKMIGEGMVQEFFTEWLQAHPSAAAEIFATNPDQTALNRINLFLSKVTDPSFQAGAMKEGAIASLWGGIGAAPAAAVNKLSDRDVAIMEQGDLKARIEAIKEKAKNPEETKTVEEIEEEVKVKDEVVEEAEATPPEPVVEEVVEDEADLTPEEPVQEEPSPPEETPEETEGEPEASPEPEELPQEAPPVDEEVDQPEVPQEQEQGKEPPKAKEKEPLSIEDLIAQQIAEDPAGLNEEVEYDENADNDEALMKEIQENATPDILERLSAQFGEDQESVQAPDKTPDVPLPLADQDPNDLLEVMAEEQQTDLDTLKEQFGMYVPEEEVADTRETIGITYGEMVQPVFVPADGGKPIYGKKHAPVTGKGEGGHNYEKRDDIRNSVAALKKRTAGMKGQYGYGNKKGEFFTLEEITKAKIGTKKSLEEPEGAGGKWRGEKGPVIVAMRNAAKLEKAADQRFEKKVALMRDGMTPEQEAALDKFKPYVKSAARSKAYTQGRPQDYQDLYQAAMEEAITFVMKPGNEGKFFRATDVVARLSKGTNLKALVAGRGAQERGEAPTVSAAGDVHEAKAKAEAIEPVLTEADNIAADAAAYGISLDWDNPEQGLADLQDMTQGLLDMAAQPGASQAGVSKQLTALSRLKLQIEGQLLPEGDKVLSDFEEGTPEYDQALAEFEERRAQDQAPGTPYEHTGKVATAPSLAESQAVRSKGLNESQLKAMGLGRAPTEQDSLPNPMAGAMHSEKVASDVVWDPSKEKMHGPFKSKKAADAFIAKRKAEGTDPNWEKAQVVPTGWQVYKSGPKKGQGRFTKFQVKYRVPFKGRVVPEITEVTPEQELHSIGTRVYGKKLTKLSDTDLAIERERRAEFNRKRDEKQAEQKAKRDKKRYAKQNATKAQKRKMREQKAREKEAKKPGKISLWDEKPAKERAAEVTPEKTEEVLAKNAVNKPAKKKQLTKEDREVLALYQKNKKKKIEEAAKAENEPQRATGAIKYGKLSKKRREEVQKKLMPSEIDLHEVTQEDMDAIEKLGSAEDFEIVKGVMGVGDRMYEPDFTKEETAEEIAEGDKLYAEATERGRAMEDTVPAPEIGNVHDLVLQELQQYPNIDKKTGEPKVNKKGELVPWSTTQAQEAVNDILNDRETEMTTNLTGSTKKAVADAYGKLDDPVVPTVGETQTIDDLVNDRAKLTDAQAKKKMNLFDNERGGTPIFTDVASLIIDAAKALGRGGKKVADTFDVEAPWRRQGAADTGRAFKNFFSTKNMHAEEGIQEAEHIRNTLKESIPEPTDRDWADVVLLYEDKAYRRKMQKEEPARFALLQPASDEFGKFWTQAEDMLKHRGIDNNPIDRMLADYERKALEADTFSKQMDYLNRIDDLMNTNYVHVSIASMFNDSMRSKAKSKNRRIAKRATAFLAMASQKKRTAVSISKLLKDHSEVLEYSDVNPIDILMRYQTRFGKDMALLDVRDALKSDGFLQSVGKKKPKGWIKLGKTYGVLGNHYAEPDAVRMIDNLYKSTEGGNVLTRALSYIKMAAFYNPIFLPAYDVYQAMMSGVAIRHMPAYVKNLAAASKDVKNRSLTYKEAMTAGTFSKPFDYPFKDYMRDVQTIIQGKASDNVVKKFGRSLKEEMVGDKSPMHTAGRLAALRPLYRLSWSAAWSLDEMVRTATYRTLKEKGMDPSRAGQLAAKFHGDYASVPPRTRQIMNTFMFTPTFKFAMGKLYYSMLKGTAQAAFNLARGKKVSKNQGAMAMALASTAGVTAVFDAFMRHFGYEAEGDDDWNKYVNFGRRYVTTIKDERGRPRELVLTWSNPGNLIQRYAQRAIQAGKIKDETGYMGALVDVTKWDLHPAFTTFMNMVSNRGDEGEEIWNRFDDPTDQAFKQSKYALTRMIRAWEAADKMFDTGKDGKNLAHEYLEKDGNPFAKLVTFPLISIASAYTRSTPDERTKYRVNQLKRDFKSSQKRYYKKRGSINKQWLENFKGRVEEEHERYKRRKRGD